jgi:hypothetical protein
VVAWRSGFATTHTGLRPWLKHWLTMVFSLLPARSRHLGDPTWDGAVPEGLMEWPRPMPSFRWKIAFDGSLVDFIFKYRQTN